MTGDDAMRPRSPLAAKLGRLTGLAVDAAVSHTKAHCCDGDGRTAAGRPPDGEDRTPSGADSPPKFLPEIDEFLGRRAEVRCRPSFTDTVGSVVITYVSPADGLAIQATAARHVIAGQLVGPNAMGYGVAVQPPSVDAGANDVIARMDHPGNAPAPGCYLGSVSASTAGTGPTRPVIIYVDGVT